MSRRTRSAGSRCHSRQATNSPGSVSRSAEHVRERLRRRLLHRQHLDARAADQQVIALALDRRVRDEVVEVRVA